MIYIISILPPLLDIDGGLFDPTMYKNSIVTLFIFFVCYITTVYFFLDFFWIFFGFFYLFKSLFFVMGLFIVYMTIISNTFNKKNNAHIVFIYVSLLLNIVLFIFDTTHNLMLTNTTLKVNDYLVITTLKKNFKNLYLDCNSPLFLFNFFDCGVIFENVYRLVFEKCMFNYKLIQLEFYNYDLNLLYQHYSVFF